MEALARFQRPVLLLLSGNDLTAKEFMTVAGRRPGYRRILEGDRITKHDLPGVDHTFSRRAWRDDVADKTIAWINRL